MVDPRRFLSTVMPRLRLRVEAPLVVDRQAEAREQRCARGRPARARRRPARRRDPAPRPSPAPPPRRAAGRSPTPPPARGRRCGRSSGSRAGPDSARPTATTSALTRTARAMSSCVAAATVRSGPLCSSRSSRPGVGDEAALDHLGEPGDPLARRQRLQEADVGDDRARLVERADQVLARRRRSTPVLPPTDASTIASSVVGTSANGTPRR